MSHYSPQYLALNGVLERLSNHLDGLADEVHQIEHAVGEELGSADYNGSENIMRLQRLDFLRQSLEDMALLTLGLSHAEQGRVDIAMTQKLRLDASREVLLHALRTVKPPTLGGKTRGDVDLF